jgi:PAS domain S-box-containing protein
LLAAMADAALVVDGEGRVEQLNPAAERLIGATTAEVGGRSLFALMSGGTLDELRSRMVRPGGLPFVAHGKIEKTPGSVGAVSLELTVSRTNIRDLMLVVARELGDSGTDRVLTEERLLNDALRRQAQQQTMVANLGRAALLGRDLDDLLEDAVTGVAEIFDVEIVAVLELDESADQFKLRSAHGSRASWTPEMTVPVRKDSPAGLTLETAAPVTFHDLASDERFAPIRGRRRPYGVLAAHSKESRHFGEDDVVFLRAVANVVAAAIMNRRTEDELRRALEVERLVRLESETATRALTETVARLDTLLNHAPIGLAFFDLGYRFLRVNQPLADVNGVPVEQHLGRTLEEVSPNLWPTLEPVFRQVLGAGEAVVGVEVGGQTRARPGAERHFLVSAYPVIEASGGLIGLGTIVVEITDRKRAERRAHLIAQASDLFASAPDLDDLLDEVCRIVVPTFADSAHLYLLPTSEHRRRFAIAHTDPDMRERLIAAEHRWPFEPEREDRVGASMLRHSTLTREITDDIRRAAAIGGEEHLDMISRHAAVSAMSVPLGARGGPIGVLLLMYTEESARQYDEGDLDLAEELALRLEQAIANARLAEEAERARDHLLLLARVGELATVELDSTARLEQVARVVLPTFADVSAVYVLEDDGRLRLSAYAHVEPDRQAAMDAIAGAAPIDPDSAAPPAEAVRTAGPVLLSNVPGDLVLEVLRDAEQQEAARATAIRSLLSVPMLGPEGPLGALVFGYAESRRRYGREDVPVAQELARRVSPAVENAFRFEREQATAEMLQRSLLPEELPSLDQLELTARYLPGTSGVKIGGDWYDVVRIDDGRVVLAIGDVVGHGVRAAASMGKLRHTLQFLALEGLTPAAMLDRLNAYVCNSEGDMATLLVAIYSPATGSLQFSSAGHPPPLVREPDGALIYLPGGRGMPLGASISATFQDDHTVLEPGSVLVMYTDGLIERRREPLDVGFLRLGEVASHAPDDLDRFADYLLDELLEQRGPSDDVAILVVRSLADHGSLELFLPARPGELAPLRRTLNDWLARIGATTTEAFEVTVSVNEIAANAIEHAYGLSSALFEVEGSFDGATVIFTVRDTGQWREPRPNGDRGRGIDMARALMDQVDISPGPEGTEVKLRRRLRGAARG